MVRSFQPLRRLKSSKWDEIQFLRRRYLSSLSTPLTIGILRESYDKWERRVPLCPENVKSFLYKHPLGEVIVQPSPNRVFTDAEYTSAGAKVCEDLSSADLILGVKRPKSFEQLPGDRTYMFFSHVIKGQPENMGLLQECLDQKVQLIDYECIVEDGMQSTSSCKERKAKRLVAFGKYAGLAGMVDTFPALGKRLLTNLWSTPFLACPPAIHHHDLSEVKRSVSMLAEKISSDGLPDELEPLIFTMTGKGGNVYRGVRELFDILPHENVSLKDLPEVLRQSGSQRKVYAYAPEKEDIYKRIDGGKFDRDDYMANPCDYKCNFSTDVAPYTHVIMNCAYWDPRYPRLLTKNDLQDLYESGNNRLLVVSDISCDVGGSIEFFQRSTTIDRPAYQYDPIQGREVSDHIDNHGVTMLGVDILPTELPVESSMHFGGAVSDILDDFVAARTGSGFDTTKLSPKLANAMITTSEGELTREFKYLKQLMHYKNEDQSSGETKSTVMMLEGHLFDSGLINQILDMLEKYNCSFEFQECHVRSSPRHGGPVKSSAVIQVTGDVDVDFNMIASKIADLVGILETAEATFKMFDKKNKPAYVKDPDDKTIVLLGSGLVSKSVVDLLGRTKDRTVVVASSEEEEARAIASVARRGRPAHLDVRNDPENLSKLMKEADIVISLLPAPMHPEIAEMCIELKKDLVTASYESNDMLLLEDRAKAAGIKFLNEVGLDPGLDHMSAMKLIDDIHERGGTITSFNSVCGGLPAPEAANNPLKYKFSWSPRGVISASQNDAMYRSNGTTIQVEGRHLLANAVPFEDAWPELDLEVLPNRNSINYEGIYGIENVGTIFRGTLRYRGFSSLMHVFKNIGLFDTYAPEAKTWDGLLKELMWLQGFDGGIEDFLFACADGDRDLAIRASDCLHWLGIAGDAEIAEGEVIIDLFARALEERLQYGNDEYDMVVMHHTIKAHFDDGSNEEHHSSLKAFGDRSMSAMCKTVGYPTAVTTDLILKGKLDGKSGLLLPTIKEIYQPTLEAIEKEGIIFEETVKVDPHPQYA